MRVFLRIFKKTMKGFQPAARLAAFSLVLLLLSGCVSAIDSGAGGASNPTGSFGVGPVERPPVYVDSAPEVGCPDSVWDYLFELLAKNPRPAPEQVEEALPPELRADFNEICRTRYRTIYDLPQAPDRNQLVEIPERVIPTIEGKANQPQVSSNPLYQIQGPPLPEDPELLPANNSLNRFLNSSE